MMQRNLRAMAGLLGAVVARGDSISANGLLFEPVIRATVQQ